MPGQRSRTAQMPARMFAIDLVSVPKLGWSTALSCVAPVSFSRTVAQPSAPANPPFVRRTLVGVEHVLTTTNPSEGPPMSGDGAPGSKQVRSARQTPRLFGPHALPAGVQPPTTQTPSLRQTPVLSAPQAAPGVSHCPPPAGRPSSGEQAEMKAARPMMPHRLAGVMPKSFFMDILRNDGLGH